MQKCRGAIHGALEKGVMNHAPTESIKILLSAWFHDGKICVCGVMTIRKMEHISLLYV